MSIAGMNLSLSLDGDVQLNRTLIGVERRALDWRPAWHAIGDELMNAEKRQFASEGAFGSGGWPALSEFTKARRVALGFGPGPILDMTGALKRSLTVKGAAGQVWVVTPASFAFGTNVEYAGYHQRGRGVPRRRPLELPESTRRDVVKIAQRFWRTGKV